jgi:hypothetical protein
VNFTYRFYVPFLQRWLNSDPVSEEGGWNLFKFVHNNPIASLEFLGLWKDPNCVRACEEAFEDVTAIGYWNGVAVGLLQSLLMRIAGGEGIITDGGRLKQLCRAGKLTRFGRWLKSTTLWSIFWEAVNRSPGIYGLDECIKNCPEAKKCPKARLPQCLYGGGGRNDPPNIILF